MNLAQLRIFVRDKLMAGGGQNTNMSTDNFWVTNEIDVAINQGQTEIWKAIRRARSDYFTRILNTTDAALTILGRTFTPSTLAWVSGTGNYTLPPDFVRMLSVTDLTASSAADMIRITFEDMNKEHFRVLMNQSAGTSLTSEFYGQVIGQRTLLIRPIPATTRDWQFIYEKLLAPLKVRNTGTASVNNGSATVTFSATALATTFMQVGDELILSTSSTAPTADPNNVDAVIKSVDSATQVTLDGPYYTADGSNLSSVAYICANVSEIPSDYHQMLGYYALKELFAKGPNPSVIASQMYEAEYNRMLQDLIADVEIRQSTDRDYVEAYLEDVNYGYW